MILSNTAELRLRLCHYYRAQQAIDEISGLRQKKYTVSFFRIDTDQASGLTSHGIMMLLHGPPNLEQGDGLRK